MQNHVAMRFKGTENQRVEKEKVRILRIIARLNIGGPAMQAVFLNKAFNSDSFKSKLIYGSLDKSEGDMSYLLDEAPQFSIYIGEMRREVNLIRDFITFIKIISIILRERPHIVHTHTAKAGALGRMAAFITGVPIRVHTFHGHIFEGYFGGKKTVFFKMVERFLARFTDRIIVLSPTLKEQIMHVLGITDRSKLSVIPLGVETELFLNCESLKGQFKRELNLYDETRLVGIVGRLTPIKNHKMFIDAAKIIMAENGAKLDIKFVVVGDGDMRESISAYAKENDLLERMVFTGWRKDLAKIYADMDVVSLCSINEGTPVSLIEAMLAGRPVVATDVGGVRDIVSHSRTGYLVQRGDARSLAGYIMQLLSNDEMSRKVGQAAREYSRKIYIRERLANDMDILYKDLLKKKGVMT